MSMEAHSGIVQRKTENYAQQCVSCITFWRDETDVLVDYRWGKLKYFLQLNVGKVEHNFISKNQFQTEPAISEWFEVEECWLGDAIRLVRTAISFAESNASKAFLDIV